MLTTQGLEESNVNMLSIERSLKFSLMLSWLIESSIFWPLRSIKLCTRACLTPRSKASHCVSLSPQKLSSSFTFPLHILWQYLSDVSPYNQLIKLNPFNTHKQIMYFLKAFLKWKLAIVLFQTCMTLFHLRNKVIQGLNNILHIMDMVL